MLPRARAIVEQQIDQMSQLVDGLLGTAPQDAGRLALGQPCTRPPCYPFPMKVGEALRMLQADGWYLVATRGSHRQFKHASKPGRVTVLPGKPSDDLAPGTLNSIQKQAGLKS